MKEKRLSIERTIIFCRRPIDCAELWSAFSQFLKQDMTDPPGFSFKISEMRIVTITLFALKNLLETLFCNSSLLMMSYSSFWSWCQLFQC